MQASNLCSLCSALLYTTKMRCWMVLFCFTLLISYNLKLNFANFSWFMLLLDNNSVKLYMLFFVCLFCFIMIIVPHFIFCLICWRCSQCSAHQAPLLHSNQHTQCHTKDSGFYLYFFICYRHSHNNRRETVVSWRAGDSKKDKDLVLCQYRPCHPTSPSFAISFSFGYDLLFSQQVFLFWPCAWDEGEVTEKRERGRTNYFSTVLPSSLTVALLPTDKQRDKSIRLSALGWGWQTTGGQTAHLLQESRPCLHHSTQEHFSDRALYTLDCLCIHAVCRYDACTAGSSPLGQDERWREKMEEWETEIEREHVSMTHDYFYWK